MTGIHIALMLLVFVVAMRALRADYSRGLALCVALIVASPDYLRISFGGGIPELTVQRLLLVGLLFSWLRARSTLPVSRAPFFGGMVMLGIAQLISMILSKHFSASLKSFFAYALEVATFYYILARSLQSREQVLKVLYAVGVALGVVGLLATIEKYFGLNLTLHLLKGDGWWMYDITATFPHRILLGYAMAMGVAIFYALIEHEERTRQRRILWGLLLLVIGGCYFSNSRGPWSGLVLGLVLLFALGSGKTRHALRYIAVFAVVILATRPGVRDTLHSAVTSTFQEDSVKGKSYEYRWKLWEIAFAEIKQSSGRTLFGYGGLSTETMDLSHYFDRQSGGIIDALGYTSWDNQLACDLIEFGYFGFVIEVVLLLAVLVTLLRMTFRSTGLDRTVMAASVSACVIFLYAMSNVALFSPQLKCLFWTLMACGLRYGQLASEEVPVSQVQGDVDSADAADESSPQPEASAVY